MEAQNKTGPSSSALLTALREHILQGKTQPGDMMPTVRELSSQYNMAQKTVIRAFKGLEAEGLIESEPRQGYRVQRNAIDPNRGCPIAYVMGDLGDTSQLPEHQSALLAAMQRAASQRGWSMVTTGAEGRLHEQVIGDLLSSRISGVITDTLDRDLIKGLKAEKVPVVMADVCLEGLGIDTVMQDGHNGGLLATRYLLEKGYKRIAWFGPIKDNPHSMDRLGGVTAALCNVWKEIPKNLLVDTSLSYPLEEARELLSRSDRPEAVIALWKETALALKVAAGDLGLKVGKDFEMVGWCVDEVYESSFLPAFSGGLVPPAVTWRAETMAETVLSRLAERRENPELEPLIVKVPTRLRIHE